MTTLSIIQGVIIKDGRRITPHQCKMGLQVVNVLDYLSRNKIDMSLSSHMGMISVSVNDYVGQQRLIQALIDDNIIKGSQVSKSA